MRGTASDRGRALLRHSRGLGLVFLVLCLLGPGAATARDLLVATVDGSINPASADYLIRAIERAEKEEAAGLLIELDTPGGLVSSTQDIIQEMLNAKVPVIVYVTPRGAWAASAGTFITLASTVAAMSPGTSIGAAHPVSAVGGSGDQGKEGGGRDFAAEKAENFLAAYVESIAKQKKRNVEWAVEAVRNSVAIGADEALEIGVIDLVAKSREELLEKIEGNEVMVDGEPVTLAVVDAPQVRVEMTVVQSIFAFLADPNVAVLLLAIGVIGIYMEVQAPGMIVPGAVGVGALILAGFAFQILPFSWIGLLLVIVGIGLMIAELFVTSFGLLFAGGIACFLVGGSMVFDRPTVSDLTISFWEVLVPTALAMTLIGALIAYSLGRTLFVHQTTGLDEMIGLVGRSTSAIEPRGARRKGTVFVRGEYWSAEADEAIEPGEAVEVLSIEGLTLHVRRAEQSRS
ncbi:MAG: NfeD family protein [bacterium]